MVAETFWRVTNEKSLQLFLATGFSKSGRHDSNVRPPAPKAGALARLSYAPKVGKQIRRI